MKKHISVFLVVANVIAIVLLIALIGYMLNGRVRERRNQVELDRLEVHYDADDLFVIADKRTGLVGIYYGVKPIHYFYSDDMFRSDLDSIPYLIIGEGR